MKHRIHLTGFVEQRVISYYRRQIVELEFEQAEGAPGGGALIQIELGRREAGILIGQIQRELDLLTSEDPPPTGSSDERR